MDKVKENIKKVLKKVGSLLKKIMKIKVGKFNLLGLLGILVIFIILISMVGKIFKNDSINYPLAYNTKDGDLLLVDKKDKSSDDATKLSNNDNTDNIKYANTTERYLLFKKGDSLHLYDSHKKDATSKIISNVYSYDFTEDDKYVVALDKSSNLYSYKVGSNSDALKLDEQVSSIVDFNDKYILYISDNNLYVKAINSKKDNRRKVVDKYNSNYVNQSILSKDGKKIIYINESGDLMVQKINNGKEEKIASNVISFNTNDNASKFYYETNDNGNAIYFYNGRSKKTDESIYRIFDVDIDNELVLYGKLKDNVYSLYIAKGNKEAQLVEKNMDFIYYAMLFKDNSVYYVTDDNELKYANISSSKIKKTYSVVTDVNISSIKENKEGIYFVADCDDNGGTLYKAVKNKVKKIDTNVIYSHLTVLENGKGLYYFKDYSDKSGTLYLYNGKSKIVDTEVYNYTYINKNQMYYIKDYSTTNTSGDLYRYTGKSVKIATDVRKMIGVSYRYENK